MTNSRTKISIEDLSEDLRQVAEVIGLDLVARLVARVGGERVYIPSPGRLGVKARNRAIRNEFTGDNHKELAVKYGLTVQWIRKIVSGPESG